MAIQAKKSKRKKKRSEEEDEDEGLEEELSAGDEQNMPPAPTVRRASTTAIQKLYKQKLQHFRSIAAMSGCEVRQRAGGCGSQPPTSCGFWILTRPAHGRYSGDIHHHQFFGARSVGGRDAI